MAEIRAAIGLEPRDAVEFFRAKGVYPLSRHWTDVWQEEHARAFTVAKMMDRTLLKQVRASLDAVIAKGGTFEQWQSGIRPELERAGWWGKVENEDLTGVDYPVFVGPARLRTIYGTNLRMARAAGKWKRIQALKGVAPYLRYSAILDGRTRPLHRAWHGTILPVDHPWWDTHFPPCGWHCRCTVVQLSRRDLQARGWAVTEPPAEGPAQAFAKADGEIVAVPAGIDPGFAYNVGRHHLFGLAPGALDRPARTPLIGPERKPAVETEAAKQARMRRLAALPPMPAPRSLPASILLPEGTAPEVAIARFLDRFAGPGDGVSRILTDVTGEPLVISESFFWAGGVPGRGALKFNKDNFRVENLLLMAEALLDPDEIWWAWEYFERLDRWQLRRRYLARFVIDGRETTAIVSLNTGAAGWEGVTGFATRRRSYVENQRGGVLAYRRE